MLKLQKVATETSDIDWNIFTANWYAADVTENKYNIQNKTCYQGLL